MTKRILSAIKLFTVICATTTLLQSCTKVAKNLHFNLAMQTGSVNITIPATPLTSGPATFGPASNTYNVDSFIKAQTGTLLGVQNITSAKLTSCVLIINNPDIKNNLQNFQSASAQFSSNTNSTPYIINVPFIPDSYGVMSDMPVDTAAELSSYLGNQFIYSVTGKLRKATTVPLNCTLQFTFSLVVQG
jgi:hypothetical protein